MRLQDELAGTENRIAVERKRYNDVVQDYNTYIRSLPEQLGREVCWLYKRNDAYFKTDEGARPSSQGEFRFQQTRGGTSPTARTCASLVPGSVGPVPFCCWRLATGIRLTTCESGARRFRALRNIGRDHKERNAGRAGLIRKSQYLPSGLDR